MIGVVRRNPTQREIAGRIDTPEIRAARRRMLLWIAGAMVLVAFYSAVVFLRVDELAKRLPDWPAGFPTLVAALFTLLTLAALVMLSVWAANRSSLRDAKDALTPIVEETHAHIADYQQQAEDHIELSRRSEEQVITLLADAERIVQNGQNQVVRYVQKTNLLMGQSIPILPLAEHLGPFARVEHDLAAARLDEAATVVAQARRALSVEPDFSVALPLDNEWEPRTRERAALPNPDFVDPARLEHP